MKKVWGNNNTQFCHNTEKKFNDFRNGDPLPWLAHVYDIEEAGATFYVSEKLDAQAFVLVGPWDDPRNVGHCELDAVVKRDHADVRPESGERIPSNLGPAETYHVCWSQTQFYSVDISQSRIDV